MSNQPTSDAFAVITKKLGFAPWGGCDQCPNLDFCHKHERELKTLPCELSDEEVLHLQVATKIETKVA